MKLFTNRILRFLRDHHINDLSSVAVAVSGGIDSMVLANMALHLKKLGTIKELSFIHINHGLRIESVAEADYLKSKCFENNIAFHYFEMKAIGKSNIEKKARDFRYSCFKKVKADWIFLAHHIDDSFEWHLMQKFKSSSMKSSLGIPLRRSRILRPFMCVTKNQIRSMAKKENIKYFEDVSNTDLSFERNFIRQEIIPKIQKKYPNYLKHYVFQANELARNLNLHLIGKNHSVEIIRKKDYTYLFDKSLNNDFHGIYNSLESEIVRLSHSSRGKLNCQIYKSTLPVDFSAQFN